MMTRTCFECGRRHEARGLCRRHYQNARRSGTLPPPDPIVVERLAEGTLRTPVMRAEQAAAIAALDHRGGYSAREIAARVGCTARTVHRHRAQQRKAAA